MKRQFTKILSLVFVIIMAFSAVGCNTNSNNTPSPEVGFDTADEHIIDPIKTNDGITEYAGISDTLSNYKFDDLTNGIKAPDGRPVKDIVGAVNWGGKYNFTKMGYLQEGAEMVAKDLGSSVFKASMAPDYAANYPFNTEWDVDNITNLTELASSAPYKEMFAVDGLKTFILSVRAFNDCPWTEVIDVANKDFGQMTLEKLNKDYYPKVKQEFKELTEYLLATYHDEKDKTIILSNWEGDNAFHIPLEAVMGEKDKEDVLFKAMAGWLNARQDGINEARNNPLFADAKVKVYGCIEVSHMYYNMPWVPNRKRMVYTVVPMTYGDLYSISDWDSHYYDLSTGLDLFMEYMPNPNPDFAGKKNLIFGEFGCAENIYGGYSDVNQMTTTMKTMKEAVEWGVQYMTYWAYFDNERRSAPQGSRPINSEMQGFWMLRPDGTFSSTFWSIKSQIDGKDYLKNVPNIKILTPDVPMPIKWDIDSIIFEDDLSINSANVTAKMADHSPIATGVDDPNAPSTGEYGLNFCDMTLSSNKPYFSNFTKYYDNPDYCGFNRWYLGNTQVGYITYDVLSTNFGFFMFNYGSAGSGLAYIMGKEEGKEFEKIEGVAYQEYRVGGWGQTFVNVQLKKPYKQVKIVLSGTTAWDPIISKVVFLADENTTLPAIPKDKLFPDHPQNI